MKYHPSRPSPLRAVTLSLIALAWAAAAGASEPFFATIKNSSRGIPECLVFGDHGQADYPERFDWGNGSYCGLGSRDTLVSNRQALWTFTPLGNDEYLITNASRGSSECLIMSGDGGATYPSRYNWGAGAYCGFPGGFGAFLENRQGVWKLTPLGGDDYLITNASRDGEGECLVFAGEGENRHPERFDWGPGDDCGFPGGRSALLENRQAVWTIEEIRIDSHPIPAAWLGNVLLFENVMHPHQRLHVGHDGDGRLYADWGEDSAYRWTVEPANDGHFFFLRNAMYTDQRLHVGHDGNGQLYAGWSDDDAFKWTAEPVAGGYYMLRNKQYPDQRLHVGHDGNGQLYAEWGGNDGAYEWRVIVTPTASTPIQQPYQPSAYYLDNEIVFENKMHADQRIHLLPHGSTEVYAGPGSHPNYRWKLRPAEPGYFFLESKDSASHRLRLRHGGSGVAYAEDGTGDDFKWALDPVDWQRFYLRNKMYGNIRLHAGHNGDGRVYAGDSSDDAYRWRMIVIPAWPGSSQPWCGSAPTPPLHQVHHRFMSCFYPHENGGGSPWCQIHEEAGFRPIDFRGELPPAVRQGARSARIFNCSKSPDPTLFVYDEPGQKSDTTKIKVSDGARNLDDPAAFNAWSYIVSAPLEHGDEWPPHVCLFTEDDQRGKQHCMPYSKEAVIDNMAGDFNDQVRSTQGFDWGCLNLNVYQHADRQGEWFYTGFNENLKNRCSLLEPPFGWQCWDGLVSSIQVKKENSTLTCPND